MAANPLWGVDQSGAYAPFYFRGSERLHSPSLILFLDQVRSNMRSMLKIAGSPQRLIPHVKTHKMPELVRLWCSHGVVKHKCATIAEAEMLARADANDVLIAYPLIGPNLNRLARLICSYPSVNFSVTIDTPEATLALEDTLASQSLRVSVLLDLDIGMGRTGVTIGQPAIDLYRLLAAQKCLDLGGLHAYDGQVRCQDLAERRQIVAQSHAQIFDLRDRLLRENYPVPRVILGGTPTFPLHADSNEPGVELSPGTCVLHDAGYRKQFPDLPFQPAAAVMTRVVSRIGPTRVCLDVGHKAIAADPPSPRQELIGLKDASFPIHSEEHLVVESPHARDLKLGDCLLAVPTHICPTCALHKRSYVVEAGEVVAEYEVAARDRMIGV